MMKEDKKFYEMRQDFLELVVKKLQEFSGSTAFDLVRIEKGEDTIILTKQGVGYRVFFQWQSEIDCASVTAVAVPVHEPLLPRLKHVYLTSKAVQASSPPSKTGATAD